MSADYATSWVAGAGTWSRVLTIGGLPFITTADTKRCRASGCDAALRLRRSAEQGLCCCHRHHPEDEPECSVCGDVLMAEDPTDDLCRECAATTPRRDPSCLSGDTNGEPSPHPRGGGSPLETGTGD